MARSKPVALSVKARPGKTAAMTFLLLDIILELNNYQSKIQTLLVVGEGGGGMCVCVWGGGGCKQRTVNRQN